MKSETRAAIYRPSRKSLPARCAHATTGPCGKLTHPSKSRARQHLKRLRKCHDDTRGAVETLETYFCVRCNGFHVGHSKRRLPRPSPPIGHVFPEARP